MKSNAEYLESVISNYRHLDELTTLAPIAIYDLNQIIIFSSKQYQQARVIKLKRGAVITR